jgi:3-phenylpropionate/cinnamic acid dioxygenase small subunit
VTFERASVERLLLDYVRVVDDDELEQWPDLFTEDCSYQIISRENVRRGLPLALMRCDSRDMLRDRVAAIRTSAFYVSRTVRHLLGMLDIEADGDAIAVRSSFAVYQSLPRAETTLLCTGVYDDVVVPDAGVLRFRRRHCIYDGDLVVDSIVSPL